MSAETCTYNTFFAHLEVYGFFNYSLGFSNDGTLENQALEPVNSDDAMAGAAGLRGTILDLLGWGIAHLQGEADDQVLREAVETCTQV